ncbi:DJ-1/PfpI/YhbO family deglycase/protease [candidate division GN15 bacterium]|nr:DJ-1/PfpI/YhbO family deglycase/protease [candidate division GN15 bacterium]
MRIADKKIAVFVADLFEDLEFWYPYLRLQEAGAEVVSIGPEVKEYKGKRGLTATPDMSIDDTRAIDYDLLVIPGGYSPDHMRRSPKMVEFVREMDKQRKHIAAICHGPWMLASANVVKGKQVTGFKSIKDDMENAGAEWIDRKVVKYENLITSRTPDDLPAFCTAIIEVLATVEEPA